MRFIPPLFAVAAGLALAGPVLAQNSSTYTAAVPPSREALDRLNLRAEWTSHLPLENRQDGLAHVQVVDANQLFVQTKAGLLVAIDATSGAKQWSFKFPEGYVSAYPVGVTNRLAFAVNVTHLYSFHRYTGVLEFKYDMRQAASAGPVADELDVFVVLGTTRVNAYRYPTPLDIVAGAGKNIGPDGKPQPGDKKAESSTDQAARRYGSAQSSFLPGVDRDYEPSRIGPTTGGMGSSVEQRSPSLTALQRITPPYSLHRELTTPSLSAMYSVKQPYRLKPEYMRYNQLTPSIGALTPSVARVAEQANLRPREVEPIPLWAYRTSNRVAFEPVLTDPPPGLAKPDVWLTTAGSTYYSLSKRDHTLMVSGRVTGTISAPMAGPVAFGKEALLGYVASDDGTLVAVDLTAGSQTTPKVEMRANVGGILNHKPLPVAGGVYAAGDHAGVAFVDFASAEVTWRTDPFADTLLAVNEEHAYIRDRRGNLLVYDRKKVNEPGTKRSYPLTSLPAAGFTVPITNDKTDRLFLASDNGLLICLRDSAAKYAKPVMMAPPTKQIPPKKEEPKKEEPKKEDK